MSRTINEVISLKILEYKPLYEMANLSTDESHLHYNIRIDSAGADRNISHSSTCRVKLTRDNVSIPVLVKDDGAEIKHDKYKNFPHVLETLRFIDSCKDIFQNHYFKKPGYTDRITLNILTDVANGMSKEAAITKNLTKN